MATEIILGCPLAFWEALHAERFCVVYRPLDYDPARKRSPGFDWFCTLAYRRQKLCVVVDEAHQLCRPQAIPGSFELLARTGRHREISIIYITQSFAAVQGSLTQNTDTFYFFQIHYPWDIEGVGKRCGPEIAQRVHSLRKLDILHGIPGEILRWRDTGEVVVSDQVETFKLDSQDAKDYIEDHDSLANSSTPRPDPQLRQDGTGDSVQTPEPLAVDLPTSPDEKESDDPPLFFWDDLR